MRFPEVIGRDRTVIVVLFLGALACALLLPVNPWPRDGWFESQYRLFGVFPGEDNYSPIAAPAVFYKAVHLLGRVLGLEMAGEMYLASLAQNALVFLSACFVYYSCKLSNVGRFSGPVAIAFLAFVLSTGLAQAFWSESVVLVLFAAALYLNLLIHRDPGGSARRFWLRAGVGSLLIAVLTITRVTPVFLIPAVFFLLYGRLDSRRLYGYTALACVATSLLALSLSTANYLRFGRFELTSSTGRRLWQGATPIVNDVLGDSPEFQKLKAINPEIQGKPFWEIQLPDDDRSGARNEKLRLDDLLGRFAREAIRKDPLAYLRLGLEHFVKTIGRPPYRLGFGSRDGHSDPLGTDEPLPAIARTGLGLPQIVVDGAWRLASETHRVGGVLYPVVIFFVLGTHAALALHRARLLPVEFAAMRQRDGPVKYAVPAYLLLGVALVGLVNVGARTPVGLYLPTGLCVLALAAQLRILRRDAGGQPPSAPVEGVVYTFSALFFFGSLWFSWQVEHNNTRIALPYLPFLAVPVGMALAYWSSRLERARLR